MVLAPRKYLYQEEATGMERPILPPSRRGIMTACTVKWGYSTDYRNIFLGPRRESLVNWDGPMAMHQGNIYTCAGRQNTPSRGKQYMAQYGKLHKL